MKVSVVTTWPPYHEGIAIYSAKLYAEIANYMQVAIMANKLNSSEVLELSPAPGITVYRCWSRISPFSLLQILSKLMKSKPNIIHVQHGWFLYGKSSAVLFFPFFVLLLRMTRRPVVVTMHTVIRRDAQRFHKGALNVLFNFAVFAFTYSLVTFASKIIVHNTLMKKILEENYGCKKGKIVVIPHGVDKVGKKQVRSQTISPLIGLHFNVLSFGFLRESKGLETLLNAFHKLRLNHPNVRLVIVGSRHAHDDKKYVDKVKTLTAKLQTEGDVVLLNFVKERTLTKIVNEADAIVLLSQETDLVESSGALARVADFRKPIICSRVPKFQSELIENYDCIMVDPKDSAEIYTAIEVLIKDARIRKRITSNLAKRVGDRYWDVIAKRHVKLYRSYF